MNGSTEVLREKASIADGSMNEIILDYDRSVRRLEILMGIDGVILTISLQTLSSFPEGHIHSMLMVFALLMCISTGICVFGLFVPREAEGSINVRGSVFESIDDIDELFGFEIREKGKIIHSHLRMNADVWKYTRASMAVLLIALMILLVTIIQIGGT